MLDNVPIAKSGGSSVYDFKWEIITPNRLKLGRNNFRSLESDMVLMGKPDNVLHRNHLIQTAWYKIFLERIHFLIPKPKWKKNDVDRIQLLSKVTFIGGSILLVLLSALRFNFVDSRAIHDYIINVFFLLMDSIY